MAGSFGAVGSVGFTDLSGMPRAAPELEQLEQQDRPQGFQPGRQHFERYSWEQVVADAFDARMGSHGTVRRWLSGAGLTLLP